MRDKLIVIPVEVISRADCIKSGIKFDKSSPNNICCNSESVMPKMNSFTNTDPRDLNNNDHFWMMGYFNGNTMNYGPSEWKSFQNFINVLQEIALTAIDQKNEVIANMVKKYVKKQLRQQFECSNVVYILTTISLEKDRRYILRQSKKSY